MAKNNSRTPNTASAQGASSRKAFYAVLIAIAIIGAGTVIYLSNKPTTPAQDANAAIDLRQQYANAGPPQPYTLGDSTAPVVIEEFADYECPSCGRFATITEPDVRKRLVETGKAFYKYYDLPLPMHKNTIAASMAAACADEQGKFWPMHDALFAGQDQWGLGPDGGEVTDDPKSVFATFASTIGLNTTQWEQCFDAKKYQNRINANAGEGVRRNVQQTPTFYVNGRKISGGPSFDELQKLVTEATAKGPASAADSAMNNIIKH
jgi:protein-disulfide isomerase